MKKFKNTKSELATMQVLWKANKPLSIKEIHLADPKLNANTVAVAVKNLLAKDMIKVADITYHGSVLTRIFEPLVTQEDYYVSSLEEAQVPIFDIVSNFVKTKYSIEELEELEKIIKEQKKK